MRVRLSPDARSYVKSEASYLKQRSPLAARRFSDSLRRLKHNLNQFPQMGQVSEELPIPGVFRIVMGEYLVDYALKPDLIEILVVRHGHQRPPNLSLDDDFDFEDAGAQEPSSI